MHSLGRNSIWSLNTTRSFLSQTNSSEQWTQLSVSHSGEGRIRSRTEGEAGMVGGKLPGGQEQVEWVEVHHEDLLSGLWGPCKQSVAEIPSFSVDVIFYLRINDMNDALLKEGDICQCHRVPTRGVNCERLGIEGRSRVFEARGQGNCPRGQGVK